MTRARTFDIPDHLKAKAESMNLHWADGPSDEHGRYYWWREKQDSEPVIVRVVKSYERLLAGPWAGGLKEPAEMGGWWMAIEVPR